jgi:uncharacterized repeat protein (TIGR04052 family)
MAVTTMPIRASRAILLTLSTATLLAAGCGDDDSTGTGSSGDATTEGTGSTTDSTSSTTATPTSTTTATTTTSSTTDDTTTSSTTDDTTTSSTTDDTTTSSTTDDTTTSSTTDDTTTSSTTDDTTTDTSTTGTTDKSISLAFAALVGSTPVDCTTTFTAQGDPAEDVQISDFRLYLSAIDLVDDQGTAVPLVLEENDFQSDGLALLDFEDGTGLCATTGDAETHTTITGTVPDGTYTGVRFVVGVPFEKNHQDVGAAAAPLDRISMFWNWNGGYKYVRIDLKNETPVSMGGNENAWNIHLGATGCNGADNMTAPTECTNSNRPQIDIVDFDPDADTIAIDLAAALTGVDVSQNTPMTAPGCMSFPNDGANCTALFTNLGLDFATGACTANRANQVLFRKQAP